MKKIYINQKLEKTLPQYLLGYYRKLNNNSELTEYELFLIINEKEKNELLQSIFENEYQNQEKFIKMCFDKMIEIGQVNLIKYLTKREFVIMGGEIWSNYLFEFEEELTYKGDFDETLIKLLSNFETKKLKKEAKQQAIRGYLIAKNQLTLIDEFCDVTWNDNKYKITASFKD